MSLPNISGHFVYRSLHNNTFIGEDFLKLKFGEGLMTINQEPSGNFAGDFDMGGDYKMSLEGIISSVGNKTHFRMTGKGIPNTATEGWVYAYDGFLVSEWPNGINQLQTIIGSVIRTIEHGTAKAGYTATFYMVNRD